MWTRSYTASWGDVYTHFLFWASFFLEYFFENPAQKRINLAFLSTFLSKLIPFEQFIPFLSTFLSTFLSNIQQKYFFEHFFEYSKKYSKCWVLFWVLFWELFWGFFWDFHYDKTYLLPHVFQPPLSSLKGDIEPGAVETVNLLCPLSSVAIGRHRSHGFS